MGNYTAITALFTGILVAILVAAVALHALNALGTLGKRIQNFLWQAPGLDLLVFYYTNLPWVAAAVVWWFTPSSPISHQGLNFAAYLLASIAAQMIALTLWSWGHEAWHGNARRGPRIVKSLNSRVGPVRNHLAVWWTALAVPVFSLIRIAEYLVYPPLVWLIQLPRYKAGEWVNVSRQKFDGLVGWDLIWCLYCDWMTGIWSLGSEMLRNVESFWCPIRFSSTAKCENCSIDFPDVKNGWVPADGTMTDVAKTVEKHYPGPGGVNAWFGHPARLTINGKPPEAQSPSAKREG
jgi:hypothetical protein